MKVIVNTVRLIEDGKVVGTPACIYDTAHSLEYYNSEAALKQLEALRSELLKRALEELQRVGLLKEGAMYTIDFNYTIEL